MAALVCKVTLNVVHISFTFTASESYMMVIGIFSDAISDLMRSQLAHLYNGILRGFWLYLMGLRSNCEYDVVVRDFWKYINSENLIWLVGDEEV